MTSPVSRISEASSRPLRDLRPQRDLEELQRVQKVLQAVAPGNAAASRPVHLKELIKPVQRVNETLKPFGVQFELQPESSRVITRLIDRESGEVIRQIPSETLLAISKRLHEVQGMLVNEAV